MDRNLDASGDRVPRHALSISGASVFTPALQRDMRGSFQEVARIDDLAERMGRHFQVRQVSRAVSRAGVIRGIHVTDVPPGQGKYVTCVHGSAYDVVVDLRVGSPTFGQHQGILLDAATGTGVYLPEGVGHAYAALEEGTTMLYLQSEVYTPERDRDVQALDPALAIAWPDFETRVQSPKDASAPTLAEALAAGILPFYRDCVSLGTERAEEL